MARRRYPHHAKIKHYISETTSATQLRYLKEGVKMGEFIYDNFEMCYLATSDLTSFQLRNILSGNEHYRQKGYSVSRIISNCAYCGREDCRGESFSIREDTYMCDGDKRNTEEKKTEERELRKKATIIKKEERNKKSQLFWNSYTITGKLPFIPSCRKK